MLACELNGEGGEDKLEIAPVLEVSGAEERSPEPPIGRQPLCDRLRDSGLSRSGQSVQPVDRRLVEVTRPEFNLVENCGTGILKTSISVTMAMLSLMRIADTVEGRCFS